MLSPPGNRVVAEVRAYRRGQSIQTNTKELNIEQWRLYHAEQDPKKKREMADRLFFANYFLIATPFARRFHQGHDEVFGRAYLFFLAIVDKYDPERNISFSTYVRHWHRHQHQADDATSQRFTVRTTTNMVSFMQSVAKYSGQYLRLHNRHPTTNELYDHIVQVFPTLLRHTPTSKHMMTMEQFEKKLSLLSISTVSFDGPASTSDESANLHNLIAQIDVASGELMTMSHELFRRAKAVDKTLFALLFEKLKSRERVILHERFILGRTLEEIGEGYDITRERIRQLIKRSCYMHFVIRHKMTANDVLRFYDFLYLASEPLNQPTEPHWSHMRFTHMNGLKPVSGMAARDIEVIIERLEHHLR